MPSGPDASCAICMDSLLDARDDLDDVMAITAPDCGHVFHEPCLHSWFAQQTRAYVARMRAQGPLVHVVEKDAPNECPSCRAEVYADDETGRPLLHRLYINFSDPHSHSHSQSQLSQSQSQAGKVERSKLDTAALALARRAKGLTAEITHFTPDTDPAGVNGALARIADLHSDAAQLSLAAAGVLDKYLSPLSTSLSGLRDTLKSHPLSATLRMQIDELKAEVQTRTRDLQMEKKRVLAAIRAGIEEEKARSSKLVKTAESERDAMQRSLGREQVARRVARTAAEERLAALEERLKSAEAALNVEKADREAMQATLTERTKLMRQYQAKAESRKKKILQLQEENAQLVASARMVNHGPVGAGPDMDIDLDDPAAADSDMPPLLPARTSCKRPSRGDDLIVRMPDMSDDLDDIGAPDARPRSITARTFAFDGNGRMRKDKERRRKEGRDERKEKEREKVKEKVKVKTGKLPPLPQQQQYAPPHPSPPPPSDERQYWGPDDWGLDQDSIWEHEEMDASPSPTKGKGRARLPDAHQREREHDCAAGNENVFMDAVTDPTRSKYFPSPPPSNRVLVAESSPAGPGEPLSPYAAIPALSPAGSAGYTPALASPCSPVKRMRHNTLASPCPAARRARAPPVRAIEVIDLVSSSPAEDSGERASGVGVGAGSRAAAAGGSSAAQLFPPRAHARTKSGTLVDYLQLTDERGRPRKNLVSGDKIRHRAVPF